MCSAGWPVLGAIVSGTKSEGVFGITFAVQGPMAQPQVLVNPLSMVAPGIFREVFQMTNQNPKVIPRDEKPSSVPVEKRVRSSSSPGGAAEGGGAARSRGGRWFGGCGRVGVADIAGEGWEEVGVALTQSLPIAYLGHSSPKGYAKVGS